MLTKEQLLESRLSVWRDKYTHKVVTKANKIGVHMNALIEAYSRLGFYEANLLLEPVKNLEEYMIAVKIAERNIRRTPAECETCEFAKGR